MSYTLNRTCSINGYQCFFPCSAQQMNHPYKRKVKMALFKNLCLICFTNALKCSKFTNFLQVNPSLYIGANTLSANMPLKVCLKDRCYTSSPKTAVFYIK